MQEEYDFHCSSVDEIIHHQAHLDGERCPDREWLLSQWDSWVRNPHYRGKRGPHPEDPCGEDPCGEDPCGEDPCGEDPCERNAGWCDADFPF